MCHNVLKSNHKLVYLKNSCKPFLSCLFKPCLHLTLSLSFCLLLLTLSYVNLSYAVLSATTIKTVQGTKPYLVSLDGKKLTNLNQLLGFRMPKQNGNGGTEFIDATKDVVTAPKGMKLSDVKAIVVADNKKHTLPSSYQKDDDGDIGSPSGTMTAVWKNNGQVMGDLNQTLSSCGGTYTLTISANNAKAQTTYGTPRTTDYGSATKTYAFMLSGRKICYIKPQSMQIYTNNTLYPQGYNPAVWDAGKGFSVSKMSAVGKRFPTTGFDKAVFDVIGTGSDQSQYRCRNLSSGKWVSLSENRASEGLGQGCRVTYNHSSKTGKPQTPVTIDMDYTADNGKTWTKIDSYTIPVPSKWAISPVGNSYKVRYGNANSLDDVTQFDALNACRKVGPRADNKATSWAEGAGQLTENRADRQRFMYRRDELSNSKNADRTLYPEDSANISGYSYYSRDIGTFMGEWGYVSDYDQSPWSVTDWYWTAEADGTVNQFHVYAHGDVSWDYPSNSYNVVVCRGE